MTEIVKTMIDRYKQFEAWFNRKCGWFFTNGMKVEDAE
jgi:hypothetical protein